MARTLFIVFLGVFYVHPLFALAGEERATDSPEAREFKPRKKFPSAPFVEVRAYSFNLEIKGRPECKSAVSPSGEVCRNAVKKEIRLTEEQTKKALKLATSGSTYTRYGSKCFIPRHAFVFFDAEGKIVGEMTICFQCDEMILRPGVSPKGRSGLSEKGRAALGELCRDAGLSSCPE